MENQAIEAVNGLRRAVTIGLMGFILCLGLSYEVPDLARKLTDPMEDKARKEYLAAHRVNFDELPKPVIPDLSNMSEKDRINALIELIAKMLFESTLASFEGYMKEVEPGLRKQVRVINFGLLAGTGLLIALLGLVTSAIWTVIQSRRLVGERMGAIFRAVWPHADFHQTLLFSSRNFKELLLWTAGWLAAPLAIVIGLSSFSWSLFDWLYPLAVIAGSCYIFSFWLTLAIYAWRGKLADPGEQSVKFHSRALLFWLFFIYAPLLAFPLDLVFSLLILIDLVRYYFKPPSPRSGGLERIGSE